MSNKQLFVIVIIVVFVTLYCVFLAFLRDSLIIG